MAGQSDHNVRVGINAVLSPSYQKTLQTADKALDDLRQSATDLNSKVGDVGAFRRQQNAVAAAGREWKNARDKVAQLRAEIAATDAPTRKQEAALKRAETQLRRTNAAYVEQRTRLSEMTRHLQQNGVNVANLSREYGRLRNEVNQNTASQQRLQQQLQRNQQIYQTHLQGLQKQQKIVDAMVGGWQKIGGFVTGAAAAGATLGAIYKPAMTYEEQISRMAATAGAGKGAAEMARLKPILEKAVFDAAMSSGTNREGTAAALDKMLAAGNFNYDESLALLPTVSKTAFAGGADPTQIAALANAYSVYGLKSQKDVTDAFNMSLRAGQIGGFELKDMAASMPNQLGLAGVAGYSGKDGLASLLALNQASMYTSGDPMEAGNNVVNMLQKLTSRELTDSVAKAVTDLKGLPTKTEYKGKGKNRKPEVTLDLNKYLQQKREQGVFGAEAFGDLIDHQLKGNKQYQSYKAQLGSAKTDEERKRVLADMSKIAIGGEIGQIIGDRQFLMAALAQTFARKMEGEGGKNRLQAMQDKILAAPAADAIGESKTFLDTQTFAKKGSADTALQNAQQQAYNEASAPLGALFDAVTKATQAFPQFTAGLMGAGSLMTSLMAAGAGAGAYHLLTGGANAASGAGAAAAGAGGASRVLPALKTAGKVLGVGGAVAGGAIDAYDASKNPLLTENQKKARYLGAGAGTVGAIGGGIGGAKLGAMGGAALGSFVPVVGTAAGALVGAIAGGIGGAWLGGKAGNAGGNAAGSAIWSDTSKAANEAATAAQEAAKSAQEAAKAATIKPNQTNNFSTSMNITVNEATNPKEFSLELADQLNRLDRARAAEARAAYPGAPDF